MKVLRFVAKVLWLPALLAIPVLVASLLGKEAAAIGTFFVLMGILGYAVSEVSRND